MTDRNSSQESCKQLVVCWSFHKNMKIAKQAIFLSFLEPKLEDQIHGSLPNTFIFGREEAREIKEQALKTYLHLVANIGQAKDKEGNTLRHLLKKKTTVSRWWFHKVSAKSCENEPIFNYIIQSLIVSRVADKHNCTKVILYGGSCEIARILRKKYTVSVRQCKDYMPTFVMGMVALLRRMKFGVQFIYELVQLKRCVKLPQTKYDVLFSGFWDWSVREDPLKNKLDDRYFKAIPEQLEAVGLKVGWLAWFSHRYEPNKPLRSVYEAARPLEKYPQMIMVQSFIRVREVVKYLLEFYSFFVFLRFAWSKIFQKTFFVDGFNFYPVFKKWLYDSFLDATIPYSELIFLAHQRAAAEYKPKIVVNFLDFFLYARAVNAGIKAGHSETVLYDVQHASYSREKTFGVLDPSEYHGTPDGCSIPKPDYICAMGELGKDIFLESGFSCDQVLLTGSSRYDAVSAVQVGQARKHLFQNDVLVVTAMQKNLELELEMVGVVYEAFKKFPDVTIRLRSHPFADIRAQRAFWRYADRVICTSGTTLDEDMVDADVIIFSYSTVAEEAFIKGIPVWQWTSAKYNASVFRDIKIVPSFYSVKSLVELYESFCKTPEEFIPTVEQQHLVKQKCFYGNGKLPSENIVKSLLTHC